MSAWGLQLNYSVLWFCACVFQGPVRMGITIKSIFTSRAACFASRILVWRSGLWVKPFLHEISLLCRDKSRDWWRTVTAVTLPTLHSRKYITDLVGLGIVINTSIAVGYKLPCVVGWNESRWVGILKLVSNLIKFSHERAVPCISCRRRCYRFKWLAKWSSFLNVSVIGLILYPVQIARGLRQVKLIQFIYDIGLFIEDTMATSWWHFDMFWG